MVVERTLSFMLDCFSIPWNSAVDAVELLFYRTSRGYTRLKPVYQYVGRDVLISRTRRARTLSAAGLAGVDVASLAAALRKGNIREGLLEGNVVGIDAVAYPVVEGGTGQDPGRDAKKYIGDIV